MVMKLMPNLRRLADRLERRGARGAMDADDLVQAAVIEVIRAVPRWNPRLSRWISFAMMRAHGAMQDELRRTDQISRRYRFLAKVHGEALPRFLSLQSSHEDDVPREIATSRDASPRWASDAKQVWAHVRRILRPREALAIELYYGQDITLREVARRLGISESRTCQLVAKGLRDLRRFRFSAMRNA